jgi:hypothetical protein
MGKKKEAAPAAPAAPGAPPAGAPPAPAPEKPAPPKGTPVEQVLTLQQQGMSNYQIVQTLQQQGFSSQQVYDAMNQAAIKGGVGPSPEGGKPGEAPTGGPPTGPAPAPPGGMPPPPPVAGAAPAAGIEETVEAVVEEKWKEISATISKLNEWKESVDTRMTKFEQSMKDLKSDMDNLHKAIVAKIGEYDQNLLNVGTEIKAMEKVFSKVLPTFTENVNELARVTKGIKKK